MKRLPVTTSTSPHQRGFFRVMALVGFAGLAGAGIAITPPVGAHQPSPARRGAAAKRPIVTAGTDNFEHAVSLKAGQRLALGVSDPTGAVQPGGTWDTNFGTINTSAIYTAPRFTPPEGLDRIHYTDPNNNEVWINVRILPNPAILNSDQTPYVTSDYLHPNAIQGSTHGSHAAPVPFAPISQTIVVLPGKLPAPPLKIAASAFLKARMVRGRNVLILPAIRNGGDATAAVCARPLDGTPHIVTLLPDVGPPTGPTTSGEVSVDGPVSITSTPDKIIVDLIDGTVSAEITDSADDVLMRRKEDFHVRGQSYNWKRTHIRYVYTRFHKKWVLETVLHCDAWTLSWITSPPEAVVAEGYPQNNQPLLPCGPDACHD